MHAAPEIIVENGGETYRAEDTMRYVCAAFGVDECDCYATPTTIIVSTNHGGEALPDDADQEEAWTCTRSSW